VPRKYPAALTAAGSPHRPGDSRMNRGGSQPTAAAKRVCPLTRDVRRPARRAPRRAAPRSRHRPGMTGRPVRRRNHNNRDGRYANKARHTRRNAVATRRSAACPCLAIPARWRRPSKHGRNDSAPSRYLVKPCSPRPHRGKFSSLKHGANAGTREPASNAPNARLLSSARHRARRRRRAAKHLNPDSGRRGREWSRSVLRHRQSSATAARDAERKGNGVARHATERGAGQRRQCCRWPSPR
jgi:hypothetical protein